ncbi:MAG: AI-2E family transporter [Patulibacter sp.]|nr:AI-2E family transporter [Patulibacter sp.]
MLRQQSDSEPRVPLERLSIVAFRIGVIGLVGYGLLLVWRELSFILLPFFVAVLLTALLTPVSSFLRAKMRLPGAVAAISTVLLTVALIAGLLTWVTPDIVRQAADLVAQVESGISQIPDLLHDLGVKDSDVQEFTTSLTERLQDSIGAIGSSLSTGVITAAAGVVSVAAGIFLTLMMLIYLLWDGRGFWGGVLRFAPKGRRQAWHDGGIRAWEALTTFVRSQVLVAAIDGIGIGLGLWILGIPMAVPIGVLTFILAFIPYIGAIIAGAVAILVGLSSNGVEGALGALVVTIIVQQVESNILYPLLIGHSVKLHPLTVLLGVGGGSALLGITGAFLATPVVAAVAAAAGWLADDEDEDAIAERRAEAALEAEAEAEAAVAGDGQALGDGEVSGEP